MDNADLEKLKINPGKLVPRFKAAVTDYSVTLASSVEEIKFSPLTSDSGASYTVKDADSNRAVKLIEGKTVEVQIIVTAEDGKTTKTYTISVRRLGADDAILSQLELSAGVLRPQFSPLVTTYDCYLPCSVDSLSIRAKPEDASMKLTMKDGSAISTVQLNVGRTLIELAVQSASGKGMTVYSISVMKSRLPTTVQLKSKNDAFECAVCCGVVLCPSHIKNGPYVYCQPCLEELTRTNKMDPFSGQLLSEEKWFVQDYECEVQLAKEEAVCPQISGEISAPMSQLGPKLLAERIKKDKIEEPSEACQDCSKKVPTASMPLHKEMLCTAKHSISIKKQEVKLKSWEKRLVDELCGSDVKQLLKKAEDWENQYLKALPKPGETARYAPGKKPLDFLQNAAKCYATAIKCSSKELQAHIGLGLVMEEFFYAEDLYGLQREEQEEEVEGEAEQSSKEEEFIAICKLHGVSASAPIAIQLKAVEAEYHGLKDAGQIHKAEHVQMLHAWKSKKILEASQGSYSVDTESPLYRAKLKFQDAVSINPSDATACYQLGRLSLLLGEKDTAKECLMAALVQKPTLSPARFCLGLTLPPSSAGHAKPLLAQGLTQYLTKIQESHETQAEPERATPNELNSKMFYRRSNTLLEDGFLELYRLGGHAHLKQLPCLYSAMACVSQAHLQHRASTYEKLLWGSLKARSSLLSLLHKQKDPSVLKHCKQLSALIANSGLNSTPRLREMQMEVFQLGVQLQPSSSDALYHLGNGQLMQYDAANEEHWLVNAELSFRASIGMEGKAIVATLIPEQLAAQDWWKKQKAAVTEEKSTEAKKPTTVGQTSQKQAASTKQTTAARGKPAAQPARVQPGGGKTAAKPATSRGPTGPAARKTIGGPAASRQPAKAGQRGGAAIGNVKGAATTTGGKSMATLGELKSGTAKKPANGGGATPSTSSTLTAATEKGPEVKTGSSSAAIVETGKAEVNKKSYQPRLGLARTLAKNSDQKKQEESHGFYREVIAMAPQVHDAYIELGEMLAKTDPVAAVDIYAKFPFNDPPTFDDAFLHGEIVRLLMKSESYDNSRLCTSLIAMGKALGIGVLEKQVAILENKFQSKLLKQVYAGVHGKPINDPELQAFFKFKCWL